MIIGGRPRVTMTCAARRRLDLQSLAVGKYRTVCDGAPRGAAEKAPLFDSYSFHISSRIRSQRRGSDWRLASLAARGPHGLVAADPVQQREAFLDYVARAGDPVASGADTAREAAARDGTLAVLAELYAWARGKSAQHDGEDYLARLPQEPGTLALITAMARLKIEAAAAATKAVKAAKCATRKRRGGAAP